uniref:Uncharacterized protein n=1 Tax=viral metagenome TaxID=1070528 RepID=A0A6H1ZZ06_9ZZZZ
MPLSCGCEIGPGLPVLLSTLRAHYGHTLEALLFWELILRKGSTRTDNLRLSQARLEALEAIEERYPQAVES